MQKAKQWCRFLSWLFSHAKVFIFSLALFVLSGEESATLADFCSVTDSQRFSFSVRHRKVEGREELSAVTLYLCLFSGYMLLQLIKWVCCLFLKTALLGLPQSHFVYTLLPTVISSLVIAASRWYDKFNKFVLCHFWKLCLPDQVILQTSVSTCAIKVTHLFSVPLITFIILNADLNKLARLQVEEFPAEG